MKAIQVCVKFDEWSKVEDFIKAYGHDEDIFIHQIDSVSFLVVTEGDCSLGYVTAGIEMIFDEANIDKIR
ncbi:MAG: hypothetical protein IKV83_02780 [Muribaculaceae bacterium]|nr:hypothetical protein [Muribaculaceae bacterium]